MEVELLPLIVDATDESLLDFVVLHLRPPPLLLLVAGPFFCWGSLEEIGDTPLPRSLPVIVLLLSFDWFFPRVPPSSEATPPTPDSRSFVTEVLADGVMEACLPIGC